MSININSITPRLALYRDMVHQHFPLSCMSSTKISLQARCLQELCLTAYVRACHPLLGLLSADSSAMTVEWINGQLPNSSSLNCGHTAPVVPWDGLSLSHKAHQGSDWDEDAISRLPLEVPWAKGDTDGGRSCGRWCPSRGEQEREPDVRKEWGWTPCDDSVLF